MPRLVTLMLLLLFFSTGAAGDIEEIKPADIEGLVKIKNLRGEVKVEGWDEARVRIRGDIDELSTGLRFEVDGNRTDIEVEMPHGNVNWGDGSDLVINVPHGSRVAVEAVSTDVEIEAIYGGMQIRTISGDIKLKDGRGKMSLKTVSGGIEVEDTNGDLRASSASGEIDVVTHVGNADLETMSGEIELEVTQAERLRGYTISGELKVDSTFLPGFVADFSSVSGEISIEIDNPENLTILANTTSGRIDNDLTRDKVKKAFGQQSLRAQIGDGSGNLGVRAVSGAIELSEG